MPKRALFLYISMSSGHQRAADAVREAMTLIAPDWETVGIDSISYAYPKMGKIIARSYLEVLRRTPLLWEYLYDNPDVEAATREVREILNFMSAKKMKWLINRYSPQALVCTQAVPCSVYATEKRRGKINLPLIAVVTDFAIHSYWIYKEVDLYCVASEDSKRDLIKHGILASKIVVTGIPISPSFLQNVPREKVRIEMGLDPNRHTALVMGGSQGLGPMQELLDGLRPLSMQSIIVTGMNRDLYRKLKKRYARDKKMRILGYTKNISRLMDAADILVTKPGGMTSSEALAKCVPMVITHAIPGQEERNARFLVHSGAAERADTPEEMATLIQSLFSHPSRLRKMMEAARALARPYAAMEVARHIFAQANNFKGPYGESFGLRREYDRIPKVY